MENEPPNLSPTFVSHFTTMPDSAHAADMTTEGAVVCQRCNYSFAPGTRLQYMASKDAIRPGRHLCHGCYNYYLNKPTTVRRPGAGGESMKALIYVINNDLNPLRQALILNIPVAHSQIKLLQQGKVIATFGSRSPRLSEVVRVCNNTYYYIVLRLTLPF